MNKYELDRMIIYCYQDLTLKSRAANRVDIFRCSFYIYASLALLHFHCIYLGIFLRAYITLILFMLAVK
jgi:hypothetical protein